MLLIESIIKEAIEKDASDIHLIKGLKPILRIRRTLTEISDLDALDEGDLYDIYDYIVRGNIDKDTMYKSQRKLDTSLVYNNIRLRVNCSFADDAPIYTMRIIKNELPKYDRRKLSDDELFKKFYKDARGFDASEDLIEMFNLCKGEDNETD